MTKVGANGNTQDVILERSDSIKDKKNRTRDDKNVSPRDLTITNLKLHVRNEYGYTVEDNCSCDGQFMLTAMDQVEKAIRNAFHLIPQTRILPGYG